MSKSSKKNKKTEETIRSVAKERGATNNRSRYSLSYVIVVCALAFLAGWLIKAVFFTDKIESKFSSRRIPGFKFISPLLFCDYSTDAKSTEIEKLENNLEEIINKSKTEKDITTASIYFRDIRSGQELDLNSDEKYYPASLNKIPIMMAYFKLSQSHPDALSTKIKIETTDNSNDFQEITPKDPPKAGEYYTTEQLIEKMIVHSDNISVGVLAKMVNNSILTDAYKEMQISMPKSGPDNQDFIKVHQFSYFLRVLYNATYLNRNLSEKALEFLSRSDFKDGLVAGVPTNIPVSHKFGLFSQGNKPGEVLKRELHDCGIIYHPDNPYILCVMTKSDKTLEKNKKTIKEISRTVYNAIESQY